MAPAGQLKTADMIHVHAATASFTSSSAAMRAVCANCWAACCAAGPALCIMGLLEWQDVHGRVTPTGQGKQAFNCADQANNSIAFAPVTRKEGGYAPI